MNWIPLDQENQISEIKANTGYSVIFKHSTRCSISMMAKKRVDMDLSDLPEGVKSYFLDLINHRNLSSQVAEVFQIHHESPQLLLIKDGECVLHQSHGDISLEEALELIA